MCVAYIGKSHDSFEVLWAMMLRDNSLLQLICKSIMTKSFDCLTDDTIFNCNYDLKTGIFVIEEICAAGE